jgi:hypothetical protein
MANAKLPLHKAVEDATKANSGYRTDFREDHKAKKRLTLDEGAWSYMRYNTLYVLRTEYSGQGKGSHCFVSRDGFASATDFCFDWAELIHDADLEDDKFRRVEATGLTKSSKVGPNRT